MELALALWLLYAVQCVRRIDADTVLFVRPVRAWKAWWGPGWRIGHPLPSRATLAATRPSAVAAEGRPDGSRASESGSDERDAEGTVRARLSGETFAARYDRARRAARLLAWASDTYAIALLVALPLAVGLLGDAHALPLAWPIGLGLHAVTWLGLAITHRRLHPGQRGERFELLFSALLYPPGLLRGYESLIAKAVGPFDPVVLAVALLDDDARDAFLRADRVARTERIASGPPDLGAIELDAWRALLASQGLTEAGLSTPPARHDALARSYCGVCRCEYRRPEGACVDCRTPLVAFDA